MARTDNRFLRRFGDVYFSRDSGLAEKRHVFLEGNRLAERFASLSSGDGFAVGETGFGTGLSFLCAWQLFDEVVRPHPDAAWIFSVSKNIRSERAGAERCTGAVAGVAAICQRTHQALAAPRPWLESLEPSATAAIRLTLVIADVAEALPEICGGIDAWFLDGFSPARNPEMWTQQVLERIAQASAAGRDLCHLYLRRLGTARFGASRVPGKQIAWLRAANAKCCKAALLVRPLARSHAGNSHCHRRRRSRLRRCFSTGDARRLRYAHRAMRQRWPRGIGQPRGILHTRLSAGMNPLQRFVLASYGHALALLDEKLPIDGIVRAECGELQLAFSAEEAKRIDKLAALGWPPHVCSA